MLKSKNNDRRQDVSISKTRMQKQVAKAQKMTVVFILLLTVVLILLFLALGISAYAVEPTNSVDADRLQERLEQIQEQKRKLDGELDSVQAEIQESERELQLLAEQLVLLDKNYVYQSTLVGVYQEQVQSLRSRLSEIQKAEAEQYDHLKVVLRGMEESQKISFWQVIFDSSSIGELLSRISMMSEVIAYEKQQLVSLSETRAELADIRYELQTQESTYKESLRVLEQQKNEMDERNTFLQSRISVLAAEESELVRQIGAFVPEATLKEGSSKLTQPLTEAQILSFLELASEEMKAAGCSRVEIEQRIGILQNGLTLVGRVPYFWGGRVYSPGWNDKWNTLQTIKHAGCSYQALGSSQPYGLDCGGFVFWCALTMYGEDSWNSPVEWMSGLAATGIFNGGEKVPWDEKIPGDMVVNTPLTHIGYYLCTTESGDELYLHCCGGYGVVVSTSAMCRFDRAASIPFTTEVNDSV